MKNSCLRFSKLLAAVVMTGLFSACSPTHMVDHWQAKDFSKKSLNKVLVVGIHSDRTKRILFEDGLTEALQNDGITAYASYTLLNDDIATKEDVIAYVKNHDIQYVMATKIDNVQTDSDYVPAAAVTVISGTFMNPSAEVLTRDAYVDTRTDVWMVTSIYDVKTEQLVWQGHSETFEINSISTVGSEIAKSTLSAISH